MSFSLTGLLFLGGVQDASALRHSLDSVSALRFGLAFCPGVRIGEMSNRASSLLRCFGVLGEPAFFLQGKEKRRWLRCHIWRRKRKISAQFMSLPVAVRWSMDLKKILSLKSPTHMKGQKHTLFEVPYSLTKRVRNFRSREPIQKDSGKRKIQTVSWMGKARSVLTWTSASSVSVLTMASSVLFLQCHSPAPFPFSLVPEKTKQHSHLWSSFVNCSHLHNPLTGKLHEVEQTQEGNLSFKMFSIHQNKPMSNSLKASPHRGRITRRIDEFVHELNQCTVPNGGVHTCFSIRPPIRPGTTTRNINSLTCSLSMSSSRMSFHFVAFLLL